jgi:U2-associated protein SR140
MWPWTEEEKLQKAGKLHGFVAFMNRKDAETALAKLDGAPLLGSQLACGWGKAVPIPAKPFYGKYW